MAYDKNYYNQFWKDVKSGNPKYHLTFREYQWDNVVSLIESNESVFDYACALGFIAKKLKEKGCKVSGCDISDFAIEHCKETISDSFYVGSEITGNYDTIVLSHILEHFKKPVNFIEQCFEHCNKIIVVLPNNYRKTGEHKDMAWGNEKELLRMFGKFNIKRAEYSYPKNILDAFKAPIYVMTKGDINEKSNDSNNKLQRQTESLPSDRISDQPNMEGNGSDSGGRRKSRGRKKSIQKVQQPSKVNTIGENGQNSSDTIEG